jgi:hypothetical protein
MTTARNAAIGWWAAITILVSAFLLFQVQPVISKTILPWFGGSPAVWTTCVLFFQLVLLAGYGYAHALIRYVPAHRQGIVHGVLLVLAICTLPITPGGFWKPTDGSYPALRILLLLLAKVGLPYFLLSSSGPLVQAWFSRAYPGASPYRLYALSNVGSLLALLSYPVVFEPLLAVNHQGSMWSVAFVAFAILAAILAWLVMRSASHVESTGQTTAEQKPTDKEAESDDAPTTGRLLVWLALPALASMLLLATTNHLCQDIAVVPFMWVVPLSLYLISFILCFDSEIWYQRKFWGPLGVIGILVLCVLNKGDEWKHWAAPAKPQSTWESVKYPFGTVMNRLSDFASEKGSEFESNLAFQALVYVALLFIICMLCHGELVKQKPKPKHLTLYYLMISAGGALGGLFVALLCPFIFKLQFELSLGIVLGYVVAWVAIINDGRGSWLDRSQWLQWASAALIMGGVLFVITSTYEPLSQETVAVERNFYGTLTVKEHDGDDEGGPPLAYRLVHGGILHGYQFTDPLRKLEPTTYYVNESGAGIAVHQFPRQEGKGMRVAVVGLGAGTMAAHAQKGDTYRFYEIDPKVIKISDNFFTFRKDAQERGAETEVVLGDARIRMEREEDQQYDVIILDAFSGDAIPAHLLTVESLELYKRHLRKDADGKILGILAVHISNKHLDLAPVVAALARRNNLTAVEVSASEGLEEPDAFTGSDWILLTQNEDFLNGDIVRTMSTPLAVAQEDEVVWTDQHSSLLPILKSDWVKDLRARWFPPKKAPVATTAPVER